MDFLRQITCMVVNPVMVAIFASLCSCTTVLRLNNGSLRLNDGFLLNQFQTVGD